MSGDPSSRTCVEQLKTNYSFNIGFYRQIVIATAGRKLFRTRTGMTGLGPSTLMSGDCVCVLFGGATPYVLRRVGRHFMFLGESYVYGIMHGESLEEGRKRNMVFDII